MDYMMTTGGIGVGLKKVRMDLDMTQKELANRISKKRSFITRMENENTNLTLSTLRAIVEDGLGAKLKISVEL